MGKVRGSIPMFWGQPEPWRLKPQVSATSNDLAQHTAALKTHLVDLAHAYLFPAIAAERLLLAPSSPSSSCSATATGTTTSTTPVTSIGEDSSPVDLAGRSGLSGKNSGRGRKEARNVDHVQASHPRCGSIYILNLIDKKGTQGDLGLLLYATFLSLHQAGMSTSSVDAVQVYPKFVGDRRSYIPSRLQPHSQPQNVDGSSMAAKSSHSIFPSLHSTVPMGKKAALLNPASLVLPNIIDSTATTAVAAAAAVAALQAGNDTRYPPLADGFLPGNLSAVLDRSATLRSDLECPVSLDDVLTLLGCAIQDGSEGGGGSKIGSSHSSAQVVQRVHARLVWFDYHHKCKHSASSTKTDIFPLIKDGISSEGGFFLLSSKASGAASAGAGAVTSTHLFSSTSRVSSSLKRAGIFLTPSGEAEALIKANGSPNSVSVDILSLQKHLVRTNCMDCLDRTNVMQVLQRRRSTLFMLDAIECLLNYSKLR